MEYKQCNLDGAQLIFPAMPYGPVVFQIFETQTNMKSMTLKNRSEQFY